MSNDHPIFIKGDPNSFLDTTGVYYKAGWDAAMERACKAVCGGCRNGLRMSNGRHVSTGEALGGGTLTSYSECQATAIREAR